jgi:SAM-dependent methyltransferase
MAETRNPLPHLGGGEPARHDDFLLERRYRLVEPHLPRNGHTLLDFGCGNGAQTFLFVQNFRTIVGVDINRTFLSQFLLTIHQRNLKCDLIPLQCDGLRIPCRDGAVDCAISFEVLEHVADEQRVLAELHRTIRMGGRLVMTVPNRWWIFETHGADLPLLPWNRIPFFSWLPKRWHDRYARARIYRKREIIRLLHLAGFDIATSCYVTAPMDVVKWKPLQRILRKSIFGSDRTRWPWLATAILVVAERSR